VEFYALVSSRSRESVEIYTSREEAEEALADALADQPAWEGLLRIERLDLGVFSCN
jgi:hypothetical protein